MTALPAITAFTAPTLTEGQFKSALGDLIAFLTESIGPDPSQAAVLLSVGAPFSKVLDLRGDPAPIPQYEDRGSLVLIDAVTCCSMPLTGFEHPWSICIKNMGTSDAAVFETLTPIWPPIAIIPPGSSAILVSTIATGWHVLPVPAAIASGSNANGSWITLPDGTIIARHSFTSTPVTTTRGALFVSDPDTWTFPVAFQSAPGVFGSVSDVDCWLATTGITTTQSTLRVFAAVTEATGRTYSVMAIGK